MHWFRVFRNFESDSSEVPKFARAVDFALAGPTGLGQEASTLTLAFRLSQLAQSRQGFATTGSTHIDVQKGTGQTLESPAWHDLREDRHCKKLNHQRIQRKASQAKTFESGPWQALARDQRSQAVHLLTSCCMSPSILVFRVLRRGEGSESRVERVGLLLDLGHAPSQLSVQDYPCIARI